MTHRWGDLFDRADRHDLGVEAVVDGRARSDASRDEVVDGGARSGGTESIEPPQGPRPNPARLVADVDVLAADLLVGGASREALDEVRNHAWIDLLASETLLDRTEALVADLTTETLAADHRARLGVEAIVVDHPAADHPALASAYRGNAAHVLSFDDRLGSAKAGLALRPRISVSVRTPDAFVRVFDPASLYEVVEQGAYPGPDRDSRG